MVTEPGETCTVQGWASVGAKGAQGGTQEATGPKTLKEDGQEKSQDCPSEERQPDTRKVWKKAGQPSHTPPSSPSSQGNCPNKPASPASPFSPHLDPKVGPQTIVPLWFQFPGTPGAPLNLTLPRTKAKIHTTPLGLDHHGLQAPERFTPSCGLLESSSTSAGHLVSPTWVLWAPSPTLTGAVAQLHDATQASC